MSNDVYFVIAFASCLVVLLLVFMYMLYQHFIGKIERQQREAMQAVLDAQENERKQIAKEVHDNLGPLLSITGMQLEAAMANVKETEALLLNDAYKQLKQSIEICRNISHELTPFLSSGNTLDAILQDYVQRVSNTRLITVDYRYLLGNLQIGHQASASLCRIVLELIANTIRHAHANHIGISISSHLQTVHLHYYDDGIGIKENKNEGIGLRNIQSRVHLLNGQLNIGQYDPHGVEVKIKIPVKELIA